MQKGFQQKCKFIIYRYFVKLILKIEANTYLCHAKHSFEAPIAQLVRVEDS